MGLRTRAPWSGLSAASARDGLSPSARFRDALEEIGGLYATFGRFLAWRADLLRAEYLAALRSLRVDIPPQPRQDAVAALCRDLGSRGERLAASLSDEPVWSGVSRCAWRGAWEGEPVVVQFSRPPVDRREFRRFASAVASLREPGVAAALRPETFVQFEAWLRLADSTARERSYLETLAAFPHKTLVEYPRLIPEACAPDILVWRWVEGEPLDRRIATGSADAVSKLAEAVLEQACLLAVVDAEFDLSAFVLTPSGSIAMRRAARLVAVPAALSRSLLKYVSSVLSGDSPAANHQLVRMVFGYPSTQKEARLYDELSNLEPELKINLRFPESAGAFESNWRAVARVRADRPLFLDCLHRNLLAAGYFDADTASRDKNDTLADAQWPVVGRLLRTRVGELSSVEAGSQWILGTGLLALEGLRQATRLAEGFRDNDLAFTFSPGLSEDAGRAANRAIRTGVLVAVLLMVFLICLRWAPKAPAPVSGALQLGAVLSAVLLLWLLWRIG
jgi:hypothetical protein